MRNLSDPKLREALKILKEAHLVCEYAEDGTISVPIYIRKLLNYKGEPLKKSFEATCQIGTTIAEEKEIESILPGFIDIFDAEYDNCSGDGNVIEVDVVHRGSGASWNGRDFGTYDPGWGETEIETDDDEVGEKVTAAIEDTIQSMLEHCGDYFNEGEATVRPKLEKIKSILAKRSDRDYVYLE